MGDSSDENEHTLKSNKRRNVKSVMIRNTADENGHSKDSKSKTNSSILNTESEYSLYYPPRYILPPHQDPKFAEVELKNQVIVICSYHSLISKCLAELANIQIASCSTSEQIDPTISATDNCLDGSNFNEIKQSCRSVDASDMYVSAKGRSTKRKYYAETYSEPIKDVVSHKKKAEEDESPSRKKAALTFSKNKNSRQRQLSSNDTVGDSGKTTTEKPQSSSTRQQRNENDVFVEPASPATTKKTIEKQLQCPICQGFYPQKIIQAHASTCGEVQEENTNPN